MDLEFRGLGLECFNFFGTTEDMQTYLPRYEKKRLILLESATDDKNVSNAQLLQGFHTVDNCERSQRMSKHV